MKVLTGGLENVPGYKFSAIECNIKYKDRLDYSIIVSETVCNCIGMFTKNRINAAPVKLCRERVNNPVKAILINATNANACTGREGMESAAKLTGDISDKLNCNKTSVLMASTGIIGHQLPVEKMIQSHKKLIDNLSTENGKEIPKAIMTTDTIPKRVAVSFETSKGEFKIAGTAKGSGMIAPDMATLLSFIITDAPIDKKNLDAIFKIHIDRSYNSITIDGDMSTNDTALILSPISDSYLIEKDDLNNFEEALKYVLTELAKMLVTDGEGATKMVTIIIKGAVDDKDAKKAARSVSESLLVKTAFYGKDPNWGRIAAAVGYSGAEVDEDKLDIFIEDIQLLKSGSPIKYDDKRMADILEQDEFSVVADLNLSNGESIFYTSDLSHEYVTINAEYST